MISSVHLAICLAPIWCLLVAFGSLAQTSQLSDRQLFQRLNELLASQESQQSGQLAHQPLPGHYEFEVAPKMEPPSVRKPPYEQSAQLCPGSDPFAGFSPKDTLCGDLNQGRVPLNPLGQSVLDESYPFELIKNKTLQFLARALPVLKLEYETIPKVARYLPSNQLLNPTHQSSPLSHEHLEHLNERFALANGFASSSSSLDEDLYPSAPYVSSRRRRRRRRSVRASAGLTVTEMSPNATLVVSSAHSAGRIQSARPTGTGEHLTVITKEGYKAIQQQQQSQPSMADQRAHNSGSYFASWAPNAAAQGSFTVVSSVVGSHSSHGQAGEPAKAPKVVQSRPVAPNNGDDSTKLQLHQPQPSAAPADSSPIALVASNSPPTSTAATNDRHASSDRQQSAPTHHNDHLDNHNDHQTVGQARSGGQFEPIASGLQQSANKEQSAKHESHSAPAKGKCSEANGFASTICHAAAAIIEPAERQPGWLQMLKLFGNVYSGTSTDSSASTPLWSLLGSLMLEPPPAKSSASSSPAVASSRASLMSLVGPIASLLSGTSAKDASGMQGSGASASNSSQPALQLNKMEPSVGASLAGSTMAKLALAGWASNAIAGLIDYFVPNAFSAASNSFAKRKKPFDPQETFVDTPASLAASLARTPSGGALGKQPPTPCPSVEEYISPTFARNYQGAWKYVVQIPHEGYFTQTIQRTSCVRQRCEFTEGVCHESPRWVSLLVAEIYYPNAVYNHPAPSDPSAQGAPMHAAPSTSSLALAHQAQLASQASQHQQPRQQQHIHRPNAQDPLQMTDSLSTYNHNLNLNSALLSANDLAAWDSSGASAANLQHLANAYNYQLLQRQGLLPGQQQTQGHSQGRQTQQPVQQATVEPRASYPQQQQQQQHHQPQPQPQQQNQQQQQLQQAHQQIAAQNYANEYIATLVAAALQQNPNLNVDDLLNSLHVAQQHTKRDVGLTNARLAQARTGETVGSLNDIGLQSMSMAPSVQYGATSKQPLQSGPSAPGQPDPLGAPASSAGAQSAGGQSAATSAEQLNANQLDGSQSGGQVECDGHDKIGCYVVRVYYDWFLVNGSCKCWKTSPAGQAASSSSSTGNSFLRRIFTG